MDRVNGIPFIVYDRIWNMAHPKPDCSSPLRDRQLDTLSDPVHTAIRPDRIHCKYQYNFTYMTVCRGDRNHFEVVNHKPQIIFFCCKSCYQRLSCPYDLILCRSDPQYILITCIQKRLYVIIIVAHHDIHGLLCHFLNIHRLSSCCS